MSAVRQLPHIVSLHDVPDVEGLCLGVLSEIRRRFAPDMSDADSAHFLAFLLGEVWIVERGDPRTNRRAFDTEVGVPFRLYAYGTLRNRLIDEVRSFYGRSGERRVGDDERDPGERGFSPDPGASAAYSEAALPWLHADADGEQAGAENVRDLGAREGAARVGAERGAARRPAPYLDCAACGWRSYRESPNGKPGWHFPAECHACGAALEQGEQTAAELRCEDSRASVAA